MRGIVFDKLTGMTCAQARQYLKSLRLGVTRGQASKLIREAGCINNEFNPKKNFLDKQGK